MLSFAAWMLLEPSAYLEGKKPSGVTKFLREARLGQTEPTFTIITMFPVAENEDEPFARSVMVGLAKALSALQSTAITKQPITHIELNRLIENGVSANLCEVVVYLFGKLKEHTTGKQQEVSLDINFFWSFAAPSSVTHLTIFSLVLR